MKPIPLSSLDHYNNEKTVYYVTSKRNDRGFTGSPTTIALDPKKEGVLLFWNDWFTRVDKHSDEHTKDRAKRMLEMINRNNTVTNNGNSNLIIKLMNIVTTF